MTYQAAGDFRDFGGPLSISAQCFAKADAKTSDIFAKRQQVSRDWNPTGTFTIAELEVVYRAAQNMMVRAGVQVIDRALADPQVPSGRDELHDAREAIFEQEKRGLDFLAAINKAKTSGVKQIVAPGLKRWVIGAMEVVQAAVFVATKVACERPWWLDLVITAVGVFISAANVIMSVAGIILDTAAGAIKVAEAIPTLIKIAAVAGAAYGGWWVWENHLKKYLKK